MSGTKAEWSMTNECEARSLLAITLTFQCAAERSYSSILLHTEGLHTPYIHTSLYHLVMIFCKKQHRMFLLGVCMNYMGLAAPHSGNTSSLVRSVDQTLLLTFSSFSLCRTLTSHGRHLPQPRWRKIQPPDPLKLHNKGLLFYVQLLSCSFSSNMKGWYANSYTGEMFPVQNWAFQETA